MSCDWSHDKSVCAVVASGPSKGMLVVVAYAPNRDVPLDVVYEMERRAEQLPPSWFAHSAVRERYCGGDYVAALGAGAHFIDPALPWN